VDRETNFADHGLQLTRMSRALKVWTSLQDFGLRAFTEAVDQALDLAEHAQRYVEASSELELMSPATLGIVCFRRHPEGVDDEASLESLNASLVAGLADSGVGLVSSTRLFGRYAIRACPLNHSTTQADVERVLRALETAPLADASLRTRRNPRSADVTDGWPLVARANIEELRSLPFLAGADDRWLAWVGAVARRRQVNAGDVIVRQWDIDRDFYVIIDGDADVSSEDRHLTTLHAGDFFGELAALDWGASFGYPRLATVRARTPLSLLVLSDTELSGAVTDGLGFACECVITRLWSDRS
jgi:hypothetical protein